jgi:hypothetical protein
MRPQGNAQQTRIRALSGTHRGRERYKREDEAETVSGVNSVPANEGVRP